jgi:hypothetical protein
MQTEEKKVISPMMGATAIINYINRTGDIETCLKNPYWPLARAILLDVKLAEYMIPKEKREAIA